jgi:hypothetical protein
MYISFLVFKLTHLCEKLSVSPGLYPTIVVMPLVTHTLFLFANVIYIYPDHSRSISSNLITSQLVYQPL